MIVFKSVTQSADGDVSRVKRPTGIPLSIMKQTEPGAQGAMLTSQGTWAVPIIDE